MMTSPEREKGILAAIFRRRGANGNYTMLFDDAQPEVQQEARERAKLQESEVPIIITRLEKSWSLITTVRIVWIKDDSVYFFYNKNIKHAGLDLKYNASKGITNKNLMRYLKIVDDQGSKYILEVEPGPPFFGVLNVLMRIAAQNKT